MKNMADMRSQAVSDLAARKGSAKADDSFFNVKNNTKAPATGGPARSAKSSRMMLMKKKLKAKASKAKKMVKKGKKS